MTSAAFAAIVIGSWITSLIASKPVRAAHARAGRAIANAVAAPYQPPPTATGGATLHLAQEPDPPVTRGRRPTTTRPRRPAARAPRATRPARAGRAAAPPPTHTPIRVPAPVVLVPGAGDVGTITTVRKESVTETTVRPIRPDPTPTVPQARPRRGRVRSWWMDHAPGRRVHVMGGAAPGALGPDAPEPEPQTQPRTQPQTQRGPRPETQPQPGPRTQPRTQPTTRDAPTPGAPTDAPPGALPDAPRGPDPDADTDAPGRTPMPAMTTLPETLRAFVPGAKNMAMDLQSTADSLGPAVARVAAMAEQAQILGLTGPLAGQLADLASTLQGTLAGLNGAADLSLTTAESIGTQLAPAFEAADHAPVTDAVTAGSLRAE